MAGRGCAVGGTGPLMSARHFPSGSRRWSSGSPCCFLVLTPARCVDSSARSSSPLVHDLLPQPRNALGRDGLRWVWHPSTVPVRRGFLLHAVTRLHRPRVFSTTRTSATLCHLPASGSPRRVSALLPAAGFGNRAGGLPWVRRTTSPYRVRLHVRSGHRISGLA